MWIDACFARPPRMPGSSGTGVENILDDTVSSKRFQETRRADVHNAARPRNARFVALGNIMFPRLCALLLSLAAISAPAYSALDVDISVAAKTAMQMGSGVECCLFSEGAVASDGKVVMAPFMGGEIGVFDPSDDTLTYFSAGDAGSGYPHSPGCKLAFTIPNDGRVIMGPCVKGVGVWDPSDSTFTFTTPTNWPYIYGQVNHDFGGLAVMDDGRALLVPDNRHAMLGIFDPSANPADSLTLIDISGPDGVDHHLGGFRRDSRASSPLRAAGNPSRARRDCARSGPSTPGETRTNPRPATSREPSPSPGASASSSSSSSSSSPSSQQNPPLITKSFPNQSFPAQVRSQGQRARDARRMGPHRRRRRRPGPRRRLPRHRRRRGAGV